MGDAFPVTLKVCSVGRADCPVRNVSDPLMGSVSHGLSLLFYSSNEHFSHKQEL